MTTIKLPTDEEANELLPTKGSARINRVGRRVMLAKAFAVKYLGLSEISVEDLLGLTDFIKESVQRIGAPTADEVVEDDGVCMPEIKPQDAFFGTPSCNDPECRVHGEELSGDALRVYLAGVVKSLSGEIHPMVYAKIISLLEDPHTEIIRTPLGILLRAAAAQGTPSGDPGLN